MACKDIIQQVAYIKQNISELSLDDYIGVLHILLNSNIDDSKIQEKGGGTQVKFKDIDEATIGYIYTYIHDRITKKIEHLHSYTQENFIPD
jgi:hypothetical protein